MQRLSRRRSLSALGAGATGAALLAACGGNDSAGDSGSKDTSGLLSETVDDFKSAKRTAAIKAVHFADQQNMDPMFTSLPNQLPVNSCYTQFWGFTGGYMKPSAGEIQGDNAEAWEFSADKLTLTIKLSDKAHFAPVAPTNGRVVDADDVVFSFNRFKEQGTRRSDLINAVNPDAPISSLTKIDSRTVQIKLAMPFPGLEYLATNTQAGYMFIVPKEAADLNVLDLRRQGNGSGPWYLSDYTPSVGYTFKRNPGFKQDKRGDLPYADEFTAPIVPEYANQLAQFRAGAIYTMSSSGVAIRAEDILPAKKDIPELSLTLSNLSSTSARNFFGALPESPFKDVRVRQA